MPQRFRTGNSNLALCRITSRVSVCVSDVFRPAVGRRAARGGHGQFPQAGAIRQPVVASLFEIEEARIGGRLAVRRQRAGGELFAASLFSGRLRFEAVGTGPGRVRTAGQREEGRCCETSSVCRFPFSLDESVFT